MFFSIEANLVQTMINSHIKVDSRVNKEMLSKALKHNSMTSSIRCDSLKIYDFTKFFAIYSAIDNLVHIFDVLQLSNY